MSLVLRVNGMRTASVLLYYYSPAYYNYNKYAVCFIHLYHIFINYFCQVWLSTDHIHQHPIFPALMTKIANADVVGTRQSEKSDFHQIHRTDHRFAVVFGHTKIHYHIDFILWPYSMTMQSI